jgi:eukaryotic-like serine/threonine-protein kinase
LKPSNIVLQLREPANDERPAGHPRADDQTPMSRPRIIDFGLARMMNRTGDEITASFSAVGSAPYMAPEQAEGRKVGPKADIYGLGAILYAMLCGRPPHRGRSDLDTLRRVVDEEIVPPRRLNRDVPRDLESICLKCLEKDLARRFLSAGALAEDLQRFLAGTPTETRPRGRWELTRRAARRHRVALATLAILAASTAALLAGIARYEVRIQETRQQVGRLSDQAQRGNEAARRNEYLADMRRAKGLINGHFTLFTIDLLDKYRPGPGETDRRDFLWHFLFRRCDALSRTLTGFAGAVYFVEFSPRGDLLAAASRDGFVRIWKTGSWELLRAFRADDREVNVATFSPDGTRLATVGDEGSFKLWDIATGDRILEQPAHKGDAVVARFTRDGMSLITGGRTDGILKLWDVRSGTEIKSVRAYLTVFGGAVVSPDGRLLATTGNGVAKCWDIPGLSLVAESSILGNLLQGAVFSHDGKALAVACDNSQRVVLLEVPRLHLSRELLGHAENVHAVAFSPDDRTIFSASSDSTIRGWDAATGAPKWVHYGHRGRIWGLSVSPDGATIASAGDEGTVKLWESEPPPDHGTITIEDPLAALRFSRDGKALATLDTKGRFSMHELATGRIDHPRALDPSAALRAAPPRPPIRSAISEDLHTILVADADGVVRVWNYDSSRLLAVPGEDHGPVSFVEITADGGHGFIGRDRQRVEFWDLRRAQRRGVLEGHYHHAHALPVGHRLWIFSATLDRLVIWDPTNNQTFSLSPHAYWPLCLDSFPDRRRLAYCPGGDPFVYSIQLVDLDRFTRGPSSIFPPGRLAAMAIDPTGQMLAGGGEDGIVRLWDIANGEEFLNFGGHSGPVSLVHFFPDGKTLATGAVRPDGATEIFLWGSRRD